MSAGTLSRAGEAPLYRQLTDILRQRIDAGANNHLPSERHLSASFGVSRITVRKALDGLDAEGLITRRQGAGTVVKRQA